MKKGKKQKSIAYMVIIGFIAAFLATCGISNNDFVSSSADTSSYGASGAQSIETDVSLSQILTNAMSGESDGVVEAIEDSYSMGEESIDIVRNLPFKSVIENKNVVS